MGNQESATRHERALRLLLRWIGSVAAVAVVFVAAPYSWMNAIHAWLGMGTLPEEPVVGYLARSTSAFYALSGILMWVVSSDLRRFRPLLIFLGTAMSCMGIVLLIVDGWEGMPPSWTLGEGPIVTAFGVVTLLLTRGVKHPVESGE